MNQNEVNAVADAFTIIRVPLTWAGQTRTLADGREAWTCGACEHPDDCARTGQCIRATDEVLMQSGLRMPGPRREEHDCPDEGICASIGACASGCTTGHRGD